MTWQEECALLARLETFDPAAFRESDDVPQAVCNFVLALAVIYNDFKDAIYAHVVLGSAKPDGSIRRTRAWGANVGAQGHVQRAILGMIHELLRLIEKSQAQIEHPTFASVVQRLNSPALTAWQALAAAGTGRESDALSKRLVRFRNSVAFHYEPTSSHPLG